jgi:phosphate transport system substrate-binding protein
MNTTFFAKRFGLDGLSLARIARLALAGVLLAGCSEGDKNAATISGTPARAANKVVIRGSNTIGEELAPRLITEFKKDHPTADFDLEPKATGYGLATLRAGGCDIAAASRVVSKDEMAEAEHLGIHLNDHLIGTYCVAVIVNPANTVTNLTREQVRDIFTGSVQNWKQVGGPDAEIHLYIRDPISGTHLGFKELAMENKNYADGRKLAKSYKEIAEAVAQDANGIGYSSVELPHAVAIKSVSVGGIAANEDSVNQGKYPYARQLHLYTDKAREAGSTQEFVQFVESKRGQDILMEMGFVPHP